MRPLHEIAAEIEHLLGTAVDMTTGEISPETEAALDALEHERDAKLRDLAVYSLGLRAEAEAVEARAKQLTERADRLERKAESLERYIARVLPEGAKLRDDRVTVGWRKSSAVVVDDVAALDARFLRHVPARKEPDKAEIKVAIMAGEEVKGAHLEHRSKLAIK